MGLMDGAAAWLADTLAAAAGVWVTYRRPPATVDVPLSAVVTEGQTVVRQPGQPPVRVRGTGRDFLFQFADLTAAGMFPPQAGDRVNDAAVVYQAVENRDGLPLWEWGEPERVTVRIRTTQKG